MKHYSRDCKLRDKAKDTLGGNYGTLILGGFLFSLIICLVIFIFGFAYLLSAAASFYSGGYSSGYDAAALRIFFAGLLAGAVLSGFLKFGISYLCLKLACGQPGSYTDVFYGFRRENLFKVLLLTAARLALGCLCILPGNYLRAACPPDAGIWLFLPAYAAGAWVWIYAALALDMTFFLLLDFPDKKAAGIFKDSFRLIKGRRRRLFSLQLKFIPLRLLCLPTLGVGSLWLEPYMHMTYTLFYLDLINHGKG